MILFANSLNLLFIMSMEASGGSPKLNRSEISYIPLGVIPKIVFLFMVIKKGKLKLIY